MPGYRHFASNVVRSLVERNSEFGTRASVGAVYDRAFFRSLTTARGHRPRLQWYQSHCYALLVPLPPAPTPGVTAEFSWHDRLGLVEGQRTSSQLPAVQPGNRFVSGHFLAHHYS